MKVRIKDICTACGQCLETCPDILKMGHNNIVQVVTDEIPPQLKETVQQVADGCPVEAIIVE